ncbi:phosphoribosyltransferase-like protein [Algoriphagus sp.]|uniref:phosphoribosyltransferase-like protein n=1 Tax=Algoriphagus sp. TaxID=1872435 RepID=UPI003F7299B4
MLNSNQENLLEEIAIRYSGRINEYQVYKWLRQFKEDEYDIALEVLLKLNFFSIDDIYTELENNIPKVINRINNYYKFLEENNKKIIEEKPSVPQISLAKRLLKDLKRNNPIFITAIGSYGKSGTAMIYYVTHVPYYRENSKLFAIIDNSNRLNIKNAVNLKKDQTPILSKNLLQQIVIVDDIIGSGDSLIKYIKNELIPVMNSIGLKFSIHILSLIALQEGIENVKSSIPKINLYFYGKVVEKSFEYKSKVFGYPIKRMKFKVFCEKYGKGLYNSGRPDNIDYPLGHKDSQMLVVFPHSTPNNTIPILWSNKSKWYPLFPRSTDKRIDKSKHMREELGVWTSIAKRLNLAKYIMSNNVYDSVNLQLLCVVKLLHEGKSLEYILSELGIFEKELHSILSLAQQKDMLTSKLKLTGYAKLLYKEVRKEIRRQNIKKNEVENENVLYLPKTFRGFT